MEQAAKVAATKTSPAAGLGAALQAANTPTPVAKPKVVKNPIVGKVGEDGKLVVVKQPDPKAKLHNQQSVMLDVLSKHKGTITRLELVKAIETDKELLKRMDTVQPVFRCVKYHERKLSQAGLIRVEKLVAAPSVPTAEVKK